MTTSKQLIQLRAILAMREEDARIARKHAAEAAERLGTRQNTLAYMRAVSWSRQCDEAERQARSAVIQFSQQERHAIRRSCEGR